MRKGMNRAPRRPLLLAATALTSAFVSASAVPAFASGPGLLPNHASHVTGSIASVGPETFVLRSGSQLTTIHFGSRTTFFNGDVRSSPVMLHAGLAVSVQLRAQLRPLIAASVAALPQGPGL